MPLNWKDIAQLDVRELRNINYLSLFKEYRKRPLIIINMAIIVGTIFLVLYFVNKNQAHTLSAKHEIPLLEEKIRNIQDYQRAQKELQQFLASTKTPLTEDNLMSQLTDFAVKRNIQIESYAPAKDITNPLYRLTSISVSITAKDYQDLFLFIYDIEKKLPSTRILKIIAGMENNSRSRTIRPITSKSITEQGLNKFSINMEVASIAINLSE
jgi:hypothetical protein